LEDYIKELEKYSDEASSDRSSSSSESTTNDSSRTTLFVVPNCEFMSDFDNFLDFANIIDGGGLSSDNSENKCVLDQIGLRGVVQSVTFHPHYQFAGEKIGDPSAFTNRSPYPMLHILREKDVSKAVKSYQDVDLIPKKNMKLMREIGQEKLHKMLKDLREEV
jgi:uncharacterized protein